MHKRTCHKCWCNFTGGKRTRLCNYCRAKPIANSVRMGCLSPSSLNKRREYDRWRYANNLQRRLQTRLRGRIREALLGKQRAGSAVRDLGCSIEYLIQHLESRFKFGMTWANYGEWHIDHITPLVRFDLSDRQQFLAACHYTNLQPLWAPENLAKSDK